MSYGTGFLFLGLLFTGLLIWGLKSGSMPSRPVPVERAEHPKLFWIVGILLALFAVGSFAASIDQGL